MKKLLTIIVISILCFPAIQAKDNQLVAKFSFGEGKVQKDQKQVGANALYSNAKGFGLTPSGVVFSNKSTDKNHFLESKKPFYFSVKLLEGHYRVILTLGGNTQGSSTTLKAESRRLMFQDLKTAPGKTVKKTIIVDVRSPKINDSISIRLKPREHKYLNWDNRLSLEFTGKAPCVSSIEIRTANDLPTIFLSGNSTVVDQEYEPWCSWGQIFPEFLKPDVVVANYAESGETLLAFRYERRLQKLLSQMKKGDYLFIEFAHNDQKPGPYHVDPFTTYQQQLKYYINQARKRGATPVLVTSMNRRRFDANGKIINTLGDYPAAMRQTAAEEHVELIDLNAMSKDLFEAMGPKGTLKAFVHYPAHTFPGQVKPLADNTHFNPYGAYELARCVVTNIIEHNSPLKKYIRSDFKLIDPKHPDPISSFHWYQSPAVSIRKPDGN